VRRTRNQRPKKRGSLLKGLNSYRRWKNKPKGQIDRRKAKRERTPGRGGGGGVFAVFEGAKHAPLKGEGGGIDQSNIITG